MNTMPDSTGVNHARTIRISNPAITGCSDANVANVFIPISDVAGRGRPRTRNAKRTAHCYDWVNVGVPPERDPRGSPFQLPARLADGLGPGSDLGHGYPRPCAPSSNSNFEEFGFPALACRKARQLRLH